MDTVPSAWSPHTPIACYDNSNIIIIDNHIISSLCFSHKCNSVFFSVWIDMDCFLSNRVSRPIIAIIHLESQFNICVFNNTIFLKSIGAKVDFFVSLFASSYFLPLNNR